MTGQHRNRGARPATGGHRTTIIGLGNQQTGSSGQYDRHLWLSNTGILTFGVYVSGVKPVASSATYLDGKWHDAVGTLAPSTDANPGLRLYVDGALLAYASTYTYALTPTVVTSHYNAGVQAAPPRSVP